MRLIFACFLLIKSSVQAVKAIKSQLFYRSDFFQSKLFQYSPSLYYYLLIQYILLRIKLMIMCGNTWQIAQRQKNLRSKLGVLMLSHYGMALYYGLSMFVQLEILHYRLVNSQITQFQSGFPRLLSCLSGFYQISRYHLQICFQQCANLRELMNFTISGNIGFLMISGNISDDKFPGTYSMLEPKFRENICFVIYQCLEATSVLQDAE